MISLNETEDIIKDVAHTLQENQLLTAFKNGFEGEV